MKSLEKFRRDVSREEAIPLYFDYLKKERADLIARLPEFNKRLDGHYSPQGGYIDRGEHARDIVEEVRRIDKEIQRLNLWNEKESITEI